MFKGTENPTFQDNPENNLGTAISDILICIQLRKYLKTINKVFPGIFSAQTLLNTHSLVKSLLHSSIIPLQFVLWAKEIWTAESMKPFGTAEVGKRERGTLCINQMIAIILFFAQADRLGK